MSTALVRLRDTPQWWVRWWRERVWMWMCWTSHWRRDEYLPTYPWPEP